jgi:stearoyl-CoA desaturase (Delta-9 desaturase)
MKFKKFEKIDWFVLFFFVSYMSLLFVLLPAYLYYFGFPGRGILISTALILALNGLGITAGYHRLYSHKSYSTNKLVEVFLLFFGTITSQNSVLSWSYDHRVHHAHTDTKKDPYSIKRGFLHAHMLWVFKKRSDRDFSKIPDLVSNKLVLFQHKNYILIWTLGNSLTILIPGILFKDFFGAFVFVFLLRTFIMHQVTFFINSLAHTAGSRSHDEKGSAADNYLISFATFGEGYHNYHHTYPSDYRNGVRWYHFDPGKWFVYSLSKVGLAKGLSRLT